MTQGAALPVVRLEGAGLGAVCAGHLLRRAGFGVRWRDAAARQGMPALLLSDAALALMGDVFGRPCAFPAAARIARRVVLWGEGDAVTLPHGGLIAAQADLCGGLEPLDGVIDSAPPAFTLHAGAPPQDAGEMLRFGHRPASVAPVLLSARADGAAVYVEAVAQGWLFLMPGGEGRGWLLGVGGAVEHLLGQSRLVAGQVESVGLASAGVDTAPRLLPRLAGEGWLALGSGALGFDPICGDGSAQSVREAILASAVVDALRAAPSRQAACLAHYQAMLLAAMRRHLQISAQFYARGAAGPWWRAQLAATAQGYDWCTRQLATYPEPRFTLQGFTLQPRELAA